jgi:hypothetical protein
MQAQAAMKDVATMKPKYSFKVQRGQEIPPDDRGGKAWGFLVNDTKHTIRKRILEPLILPTPYFRVEVIRCVLHEQ